MVKGGDGFTALKSAIVPMGLWATHSALNKRKNRKTVRRLGKRVKNLGRNTYKTIRRTSRKLVGTKRRRSRRGPGKRRRKSRRGSRRR